MEGIFHRELSGSRSAEKLHKTTISVRKKPVISVNKHFLRLFDSKKKVVYFIVGNKPVKYPFHRRSRILYIGRTERTGSRPFESLKENAPSLLGQHGMKTLEIVYVEAKGRQRVAIADKLERTFLHEFRAFYGSVPKANIQGSRKIELTDEEKYVRLDRVREILRNVSGEDPPE